MAKIYIDAGHGGSDSGALGNGLKEKDINLAVSKRIEYHLKRHGHTLYMSRSNDSTLSLAQRSSSANSTKSDIFVSVHCNASNGQGLGLETYCYKFGGNGEKLARKIQDSIVSAKLYTKNRGVKEGNFHVIRETSMPACLVELAFIDNVEDSKLLREKQEQFAVAITKGILSYFGQSYKEEVVNTPTTTNTYFRVVAGSFKDRDMAVKRQEELKAKGFNDTFLVAYTE